MLFYYTKIYACVFGMTKSISAKFDQLREILNSKLIPRQLKDRKHIQNRKPNPGFQLDQLAASLSISVAVDFLCIQTERL